MTVCPSCGKELPGGEFPFCPFCTAPLTAEPASVQEERKVVSVLFCDLVGFTAASENADPEDVPARIRPYHERLRSELEGYGGTVEKFVGDAVMAVFGAPVSHEDDAERAVRAGLRRRTRRFIGARLRRSVSPAAVQISICAGRITTPGAPVFSSARER